MGPIAVGAKRKAYRVRRLGRVGGPRLSLGQRVHSRRGGNVGGNLAQKNYLAFSPKIWLALEHVLGGNLGGNLAFGPPLELV